MSDQFEYRERLVNMYLKYRPEKLATIDKVLKMFQGREEELMNSLVKNYGPEPSLEEVQQLRANAPTLPRTAIDINTSNVSTTSSTSFLSRRKSNQQSSNESDSAIVGASPASASPNGHDGVNEGDPSCKTSSPPYHDRLRNMYLFYNPNKSGSVSKLLTTCEGKEEELLSALVRKYGPEPTPEMMNALHEAQSLQQQQEEEADPRSRLTNIYMKYNRPKLSSVDQDLAAYHGREDQLFAMLQRLYGPEPTREEMLFIRRQHAQASNHADRLRILFLKYCPERLTEVSSLLKTYEGHEDALIRELVVRYGAEPDSEEANRLLQRLRTNAEATISSGKQWSSLDNHTKLMFFYMKYNPKLVPNVDSILSSCPGMEEQLFRDLIKKYGPIPSDEELIVIQNAIQEKERRAKKLLESMPIKERVLIFYLKHAPEKAIHVEGIVAQCGGNYEQLIEDLKSRYGAEPEEHEIPALRREAASLIRRNVCAQRTGEAQAGLSKPSTIVNKFFLSSDSCEAAQNGTKPDVKEDVRHEKIAVSNCAQYPVCYRERAQRFYQKYDPSKLESLDMIMKEYAGREDMLMMTLLAHYGPEPQEECTPSASVAKPQVACEKIEPINTPKASGETTSTHDAIEETVQAIGPVSTCVVSSDNSLYRTRILRLYRMYDPEMVPEIDTVLAHFVGKESELIARLCARYGPEPTEETDVAEIQAADATLALEQSTKVESVDFRSRLIYLFMFYDPEKLCCVDRYLIQYAGEESEMMKMFIQLYGNEPTPEEVALRVYNESVRAAHSSDAESDATVTFGSTLNAFSLRYDPELMSTLEIMFSKFAHQIEAKAEALRASGAEKSQQSVATSQTENMCVDAAVNTPDSDQVAQWSLSDRVQRFLFVYDFSKVGTESDLIASYGGDEKELIRALILQYGREPTNDDVLLAKQKRTQAYRWRVTKMVRYYDPENIADVDNLMKNFEDAGEELVRSLVLKYGPEPTDEHLKSLLEEKERTANYRERVRRFFEVYDPRRVGREQHLLDTYRGDEEDLIRTLVLQYGPEPSELEAGKCKLAAVMEQSQDTVSLRDRLRNFYTVYDSTLLTSIDVMVANYEHRAEELMGTLVKRYGPEPTQEQVDAVERVSTRVSSETPLQRIQVMLLKYAPDRMDSVESLLSSYQGKEMDLLIELVRKYGPEPDANETAQLLTMIPVNQPNVRFFAFRTRIVDFFCHYDPSQLNTVDEIVDLYSDAEDECMRELSARYGPEPTAEKFNPMIFETNFMV